LRGSSILDNTGLSSSGLSFFSKRKDTSNNKNDRGCSILGGDRPNIGENNRFSFRRTANNRGFNNFDPQYGEIIPNN